MAERDFPCWACGYGADPTRKCPACGAPSWVEDDGPAGVYILEATCGLVKIGWSGISVAGRVFALRQDAARQGHCITTRATLLGADRPVELWLHRVFADVRDPRWAHTIRLPAHTEWFWPTPSLTELAHDGEFVRGGLLLEEDAALDEPDLDLDARVGAAPW